MGKYFVLALLILSGCGFRPLYEDGGHHAHNDSSAHSPAAAFDQIYIANIPERRGQYLRNALTDRLYQSGTPDNPAYTLSVATIQERRTDLDITTSSDATRAQLRLKTKMTLKNRQNGRILLERDLTAITSYNILSSQFTSRVSRTAAREYALDDLARQIETQLALYFQREDGQ